MDRVWWKEQLSYGHHRGVAQFLRKFCLYDLSTSCEEIARSGFCALCALPLRVHPARVGSRFTAWMVTFTKPFNLGSLGRAPLSLCSCVIGQVPLWKFLIYSPSWPDFLQQTAWFRTRWWSSARPSAPAAQPSRWPPPTHTRAAVFISCSFKWLFDHPRFLSVV